MVAMRRATKERRPWALVLGLAALLLAAALPAPASASALAPSYAENRVRGSSPEIAAGVGVERPVSETGIEAYGLRYDGIAVGYPLVPRGALPPPSRVPNAAGKIVSFVTQEDRVFYRVFSGDNNVGAFLTSRRPGSRAFAREALDLPPGNTAEFVQEVVVPAGTRLQRSRVRPGAFGGRGGAEQFELLEFIPVESFGPGVPLP